MSNNLLEREHQLRLRLGSNEFLLRAVTIRMMLLDPGFAQDARRWPDQQFGQVSASEHADTVDPRSMTAIREYYLRLVEKAERYAARATATPKPKSTRRRIFEWFERG